MWNVNWQQIRDILPFLAFAIALLGLVLSHFARVKSAAVRGAVRLVSMLGFVEARYKATFLRLHRELRNIYLDRIENVDVQATYVPLSVTTSTDRAMRPALDVLLAANETRLLIVGSPGSGKTTLTKSFSVGLLSGRVARTQHKTKAEGTQDLVPIYVELREFATKGGENTTLADFVIDHVLGRQFQLSDGRAFLKRLLERDRCVILLDGLDEVSHDDYEGVRLAVVDFLRDESEALPTKRARIVMTCRKQNFLLIAPDWIPAVFPREVALAPFSDDDIQRFIERRASDLPANKSAAELWDDIRHSSVLDLHRTPLILTISIGLYMHVPRYSMPTSLATFYNEMIKELLQRHDFRTRAHLTKKNRFPSEIKLRFLREFAYAMVQRNGQFEEFGYANLTGHFTDFQTRIPQVNAADSVNFISEIIDNAGLVNRVRGDDVLVFSHRSIHEYFVALQLSKDPSTGVDLLAQRALDPRWRQIILFFAAMDHDCHERLIESLTGTNLELAGHYLASATSVPLSTADRLVGHLAAAAMSPDAKFLPIAAALSAICRAYPVEQGANALRSLVSLIQQSAKASSAGSHQAITALTDLSSEDRIRLLRSLAETRSPGVIGACVTLSVMAGNDPEAIGPLWECLGFLDTSSTSADASLLVVRLLELAGTEAGLAALMARRRLTCSFADDALRSSVYPFESGHARDSNLVTLLAWADRIDALPQEPIGFLRAFSVRQKEAEAWRSLERDMKARLQSFAPVWLGRVLFILGFSLGVGSLVMQFSRAGFSAVVRHPVASLPDTPQVWLVALAIGLALGVLVGGLMQIVADTPLALADSLEQSLPSNPLIAIMDDSMTALTGDGTYFWDGDTAVMIVFASVLQVPWFLAGPYIANSTSLTEAALWGAAASLVLFWVPAARFFEAKNRVYLRKQNSLVALLADESSRRWLRRTAVSAS